MIRILVGVPAALAIAAAPAGAHAQEGHLFIVYNYESGDLLVRANISDAELETILPEATAIRGTGWESIDADPTPGFGAISCVRGDGNVNVWFDYSTGHPTEEQAIELAEAGAQKHARETGGTVVPRCGPTWNNDGARIWINAKAAEPSG